MEFPYNGAEGAENFGLPYIYIDFGHFKNYWIWTTIYIYTGAPNEISPLYFENPDFFWFCLGSGISDTRGDPPRDLVVAHRSILEIPA